MFRKCRHLTPNTALLVILGAVGFGSRSRSGSRRRCTRGKLFAKVHGLASLDATLLHPLATVIAKSKAFWCCLCTRLLWLHQAKNIRWFNSYSGSMK